jgi:hypothetical protein
VRFRVADITKLDLAELPRYDGVFLMGILHHVKRAARDVIHLLRARSNRLIILEPNGNPIARKRLEWTPSYRAAGEDSFRTAQLESLIAEAGFRKVPRRRFNLFPNFTLAFWLLFPLESVVERHAFLHPLLTVNLWEYSSTCPTETNRL